MVNKEAILLWLLAVALTTCPLPQAKGQAKNKPADANISGAWELTFANKDPGERPEELTIAQDKQALKVTLKVPDKMTLNGTGTIRADVAEWSVSISTPVRTVTWIFKAKVEDDKMSGEAQLGNAGTTKWTASKKKISPITRIQMQ